MRKEALRSALQTLQWPETGWVTSRRITIHLFLEEEIANKLGESYAEHTEKRQIGRRF